MSTREFLPVSKHQKSAAPHRDARVQGPITDAPRKTLRTTLGLASIALAVTAAAVSGGILADGPDATPTAATSAVAPLVPTPAAALSREDLAARTTSTVSRSDRRQAADPAKKAALTQTGGKAMTRTEDLSDQDPRSIGRALLPEFGFGSEQFSCLDSLWTKESGWEVTADNPTSSAYGIPQSLPGSKMATVAADWATNPVTQIRWGLGYIQDSYGSPCSAWAHSQGNNWY